MLERGMNIEHIKDYESAMKAPWELQHANLTEEQNVHPVQTSYPYNEATENGGSTIWNVLIPKTNALIGTEVSM
jgi:hypothetical protein